MSSSPDKPNISYSVRVKASIEDVFTPLDINSLDAMLVHLCMHAYTHNRYEFYMTVSVRNVWITAL